MSEEIKFNGCNCVVRPGEFDIKKIPLNCPATWKLISSGYTIGVFQLEKKLGQDWAKKFKPTNIEELSELGALLRPGPLESGLSQEAVDVKFGKKQPTYLHPALKPILEQTHSINCYQEQALRIAVDIAGFDLLSADELRKAIGKKKADLMAKMKKKFIDGCVQKSKLTIPQAEEIFGWIETAQRYQFNKCLSEITTLRLFANNSPKKKKFTIGEMYKIRNDAKYAKDTKHYELRKKWIRQGHYGYGLSLCADGRVRKNIIRDIRPAGVQTVYRVTTDDGAYVDVTSNHKFPTPTGEKELREILLGDGLLYACGEYEEFDFASQMRLTPKDSLRGSRGYIDGSFQDYDLYRRNTPNICADCGTTKGRIETHHIDGNRLNNNPDNSNYVKVCPSCHKKRHYDLGRTKKGSKGYLSKIVKIVSVSNQGELETYDIEMDGPNHNFAVSTGIITSNSHAMSYAMLSYATAWTKTHFPKEFYTSFLTFSAYKSDPKAEIYQLVQDARFFGITIHAPDIRRKNSHFMMMPDGIAFGLSHIKGIGDSAIQNILSSVNEIKNWSDFLKVIPEIHRNIGEALVRSGACDCFGLPRTQMLTELQCIAGKRVKTEDGKSREIRGFTERERIFFAENYDGKTPLKDFLNLMAETKKARATPKRGEILKAKAVEIDVEFKDTNMANATAEKHYLGISLTCSAADDVDKSKATHTCVEVARAANDKAVVVCAIIEKVKQTKTKKGSNPGQKMCFLTLSDSTYSFDNAVVFPDAYEALAELCREENIVLVYGVKKNGSLVVDDIVLLL